MLSIIDVGCRYGVFPMFKHIYEKFDYIGVDAEQREIQRLNEKYRGKKIRFIAKFLGAKNEEISFFLGKHKGYSSSKKINDESIWFGNIRSDEKGIEREIKLTSVNSGQWIEKSIKPENNLIIKLDIEGGELDFLSGLSKSCFQRTEAIIVEAHFDNPYFSTSNFFTIGDFLHKQGYWAASINLEQAHISTYSETEDTIPLCSTAIFLKNVYKPNDRIVGDGNCEIMCEVLYSLRFETMLLEKLKTINPEDIKTYRLFDEYKFMIGHKLNRLKKTPFHQDKELAELYKQIFGEELPLLSDFYQSDFFNFV